MLPSQLIVLNFEGNVQPKLDFLEEEFSLQTDELRQQVRSLPPHLPTRPSTTLLLLSDLESAYRTGS